MKTPGHFWFTITLAIIVSIFHAWGWRGGALVCLAAIVSGVNGLMKWMAGRARPFKVPGRPDELLPLDFHPFIGGFTGLWTTKNLCFPSGHAALAFATAQMLAMLLPRWRRAIYAGAAMVGIERVLENAHYVSDVVAAALLGIYGARLVWWICERLTAAVEGKPVGVTHELPRYSPGGTPGDAEVTEDCRRAGRFRL